MKNITKRLFMYAFVFALLAAGVIFFYLKSLDQENKIVVEHISILVATKQIPARTKITKDMLQEIEIPKEGAFGTFINDPAELIGYYTKDAIYQNERFLSDKLIKDIQEDLSLLLPPDHRAVSLMVNLESGVADLLHPGDFVDVLVYLPELKEADRIVRPDLAKMILQSVEILAVDQNLYRDTPPRVEIPATYFITLSVPVLKVEKLVLAQNIGNIKLALRPLDEIYVYDTEGVIWEELLLDDANQIKDLLPQYDIQPDAQGNSKEVQESYEKYYYYTIQLGDTLKSISRKFYEDETKYVLIKQVNKIVDENTIVTGTGIKIPVLTKEGEKDVAN